MKFKQQITIANSLITIIAVAIIYYIAIKTIVFTPETLKFISITTIFVVLIALIIQYFGSIRPFSIMKEFEERVQNNNIDNKLSKTAFYTAIYFPLYFTTLSAVQWYFASIVYFILLYAFSHAGLAVALKTMFAIISGATVANIFQYFVYQRLTEPYIIKTQEYLKEEEINIKKRLGIFTKIFLSATLLIFIFLIFARTISIQLMEDALRANGISSSRLALDVLSSKVNSILSQNLPPEQTVLELEKIRLGKNGFVLLMDNTFTDIFSISDNYAETLPLQRLANTDIYNDPTLGITLIKKHLNNNLYLVGVYSWTDYNNTLNIFAKSMNWLLLAVIFALLLVSLEITIDIYLPIRTIGLAIERLTDGNFSFMTGLFVEDETGIVANSIRKTTEGIRSVIKTIKTVSSNITGISHKIMNSLEQTKENILILNKEIKNNAGIVISVQKTLDQFTEYIEGLVKSVNDTIINSDKLSELLDTNKNILSGLDSSIDSIVKSSETLLITIRNVKQDMESLESVHDDNYNFLKTISLKINDSTREIDATLNSFINNMHMLKMEMESDESNTQKLDVLFNGVFLLVSSLGDNVEKIVVDLNKIDLVIDDTNLLAMNSSVISAQAGESGKGFDVISDEITKLADVTQTKILEVKNLTELLVKEKDTIKENMLEKKKFIDNIDTKINLFKEAIDDLVNKTSQIKLSYENTFKAINNLMATLETISAAGITKKEIHHLIKARIVYVEKNITNMYKYSKEFRDITNNVINDWKNYSDLISQVLKELLTVNTPINTIIGYLNVLKTKTSEIHGLFDKLSEGEKKLEKAMNFLNIREQLEAMSAKINEEPKRYRVI